MERNRGLAGRRTNHLAACEPVLVNQSCYYIQSDQGHSETFLGYSDWPDNFPTLFFFLSPSSLVPIDSFLDTFLSPLLPSLFSPHPSLRLPSSSPDTYTIPFLIFDSPPLPSTNNQPSNKKKDQIRKCPPKAGSHHPLPQLPPPPPSPPPQCLNCSHPSTLPLL